MSRPIFASPEAAARLLGLADGGAADKGADDAGEEGLRGRQPRAARHALRVLEYVAASGAGVTGQEISADLGLSRATTYRLIQVLTEDEYLVRLPDLRGFALGRRMAALFPPPAPRPPRAARAILDRLRAGLRGGIHLVRLDGVVHAVVDEDPDFPLVPEPGVREVVDGVCAELTAGRQPAVCVADRWTAIGATVVDEAGQVVAGLVVVAPEDRMPGAAEVDARLAPAALELGPLLA
ncbi:helix-turn-helix domain-containing protein [Antribacter sp. KLBMP9083]|uniref:Helix-turn-helix domain-containing protein n=1 Tax=Antribacter soli TaxID=2910976 RepID=A0AA41QD74_9MICO|nr:helix-turn-helix domain-containing protein [Antribacter soli]MCF4121028.1 helix-turn-helix domain-containing protein [Antribacter soli]